MLDLETLGTRPDACIIQIGAVLFEPKSGGKILNGQGFNQHVLVQDGSGSIDNGAVAFWFQEKSVAAMGKAMSERAIALADALKRFVEWPAEHGYDWAAIEGVWAMPTDFDIAILRSAFARLGADGPWDRRATRDARTLFYLAGGKPDIDWTGFVEHDALDDAVGQAMQVQKAMGILASG
jgi:exodeoxyribonuclease VIII